MKPGCLLLLLTVLLHQAPAALPGKRSLPDYEPDAYGPLVFPEQVHAFLDHEINYLLKRQNEDGSWDSAQPQGNGRANREAGGTVGPITITAMCGTSLRTFPEHDPQRIEDSVSRALRWVITEIPKGTLRTEVQDAPWRYLYAFRFLVHEYPNVKDAKTRKETEVAAAYILEKLKHMQFAMNRPERSIWTARKQEATGGWGYLKSVKGSNTFVSADALRELLKARQVFPGLGIEKEFLHRCFWMLSNLRKQQPNSDVPSYRYDAAGSFWNVKDIRGDVGRIASAELACLMYCDAFPVSTEHRRSPAQLEAALEEWLKHRGILDKVKFPAGHKDYGIAPWCWMYSYRTSLEAADYLKTNDALKERVRRISLNAFFQHMRFYHEPKLGEKGWIMGGDRSKELHDSCQLLDGLATMKHLFPRVEETAPELKEARQFFQASDYGAAWQALLKEKSAPGVKTLRLAIKQRFTDRMKDITAIHAEYPVDGFQHLERMKEHFTGYPELARAQELAARWRKKLPAMPSPEMQSWMALGEFPGGLPAGANHAEAWGKALQAGTSGDAARGTDLLTSADPEAQAIKGRWKKASGQLICRPASYARLQLEHRPKANYRLETRFTFLEDTCLGLMFPVGDTSALLVVGGWGGKVSGLAYIDGKDANRNATTRDGALSSGPHQLGLEVRVLPGEQARITVTLDGKPYVKWEGKQSSLKPDRYWKLRDATAIGIGGYTACIVFHECRLSP